MHAFVNAEGGSYSFSIMRGKIHSSGVLSAQRAVHRRRAVFDYSSSAHTHREVPSEDRSKGPVSQSRVRRSVLERLESEPALMNHRVGYVAGVGGLTKIV